MADIGGYAPADLFKPSAAREQMIETAPVETPAEPVQTIAVPEPAPTQTPVTPVVEAGPAPTTPAESSPSTQPAPAETIAAPIIPPTIATPVNPLEGVTLDQVATHFKDKRNDLLKAIGLDDFISDAIRYYESTGDIAEYASVKSVDYSKMSDDDVLRKGLREEFSHLNLDKDDLELLYETRISNRFKLNEEAFSEREVKAGKLEMKLEADRLRTAYIDKQKKFAAPERQPEPAKVPEVNPQQQAAAALQFAMSDQSVQKFITDKKLVLGSGEQVYNYEFTNPKELLDILFDPQQYAVYSAKRNETGAIMTDKDGNYIPDYNRLLKVAAVLRNGDEYEKMLISYGKSLSNKEWMDKIENPTSNQTPSADTAPATIWGAMKNGMVWT